MLELDSVCKFYRTPGETVRAVDEVSLNVAAQELVAVFGPSGSGKSTLLSLAAGLIRADSGEVRFEGEDIGTLPKSRMLAYRRDKVGVVFQTFRLIVGLSAEENVEIPLLLRKVDKRDASRRARAALADVGLSDQAGRTPEQLSGGEQQRVAVARALVGEPRLVLADEPTGNLDSATGTEVLSLMTSLTRDRGCAAIIVTHDPSVVEIADRVVRMRDGRVVDDDVRDVAAGRPAIAE
jgi:putative ABC transport system ATP-binding protein